ncbi:uncharacterized protein MYCFIDRAFT_32819 [Pseudocercospora fijiensis CIRAD86]|uniref:Glutamine synthetase n=1 Tax=Pseudocercospora fijiensis (strain CIRAD86) TaxID=383855 RepID=M2YV23_PSEFD|nr:uncharacterized protein MYCFIDRAFT_32819 [Pseudocercospora fijiensis CIRAD86]EME81580.1 hypothetical protein MYCFIDRAFT_32819 [Pseudocercospora fijiensis CIRAD86]
MNNSQLACQPEAGAPADLTDFFQREKDISMVHFHWVDMSGRLLARVVPKSRCQTLAAAGQPTTGTAYGILGFMSCLDLPDNCMPGSRTALYPDWSSLCRLREGHASVLCNISEENNAYGDVDGSIFDRCPRYSLSGLVKRIREDHCLSMLVGIEIEFYLVPQPHHDEMPHLTSAPLYNRNSVACSIRGKNEAVLCESAQQLERCGIAIEHYHAESGPQQFEIALGPMEVVKAADSYVRAKEIVANVAEAHGMKAIFLPRPFEEADTCGLHVHMSFESTSTEDDATAQEGKVQHFLAGVLGRLSRLCAYAMPTEESYSRLHLMTLGQWVCWGTENRDAPVRRINSNHWEFRAIDCTANIFLVLATYIGAGILGIQRQEPLQWLDSTNYHFRYTDETRKSLGITEMLPASQAEAATLFNMDTMGFETVISPRLLDLHQRVKAMEEKTFRELGEHGRVKTFLDVY